MPTISTPSDRKNIYSLAAHCSALVYICSWLQLPHSAKPHKACRLCRTGMPAAADEARDHLQVLPAVAAEAPAHLQVLAEKDAQVASLRQELAHASSGAGETNDEVIRLKAELESSHQVVQGCTSGLCLLAPVSQNALWHSQHSKAVAIQTARQPSEGCCTCSGTDCLECSGAVHVDRVHTARVAWQRSDAEGNSWPSLSLSGNYLIGEPHPCRCSPGAMSGHLKPCVNCCRTP